MAASVVLVAAVCWVLLSVPATEAEGDIQSCKKFKDLDLKERFTSLTYWCSKDKCDDGKVNGTLNYTEDSDICLSALHAGVITSLGANITVTRVEGKEQGSGTAKNRIISGSYSREKKRHFQVESVVQAKGAVGEVLMVHNGASSHDLRVSCLSQDRKSPLSFKSFKSWWYTDIASNVISEKNGDNTRRLMYKISKKHNVRAVRILGSRRDEDVLAVVQYPDAKYQSKVATVRASVGDNVTIDLRKQDGMTDEVYFRQLPNEWSSSATTNLSAHLTPADPSEAGIYIVHKSTSKGSLFGAYFDFVVRECKAGYYGINCSTECPDCQNGGQCHTRRGSCLCPPGFIGDTCQFACPPGQFGNDCQFRCDESTIGFPGSGEEGSCKGLTICLPSPYGCSCASGFTNPLESSGQPCTQECPKGFFGADCSQRCHSCVGDECDRFSGTCQRGCVRGKNCRKGSRPSVTVTPQHRGYKAKWSTSDTDAHYFFSQKMIYQHSCRRTIINDQHNHTLATDYTASNLPPDTSFNVCVVASSSNGFSQPQCSNVTTLPEVPDVTITNLRCKDERYGNPKCSADVIGGCEKYNGPNIHINFTLHTTLPCSHPDTDLFNSAEIKGSKVEVEFPSYLHGVEYEVTATVGNIVGAGRSSNTNFTTYAKKPPRVQNVTHDILSDSALQLLWNDPCPSNGKITDIYIGPYGKSWAGNKANEPCATSKLYNRCYIITGLELGKSYTFQIQEQNSAGWGDLARYTITLEEKKPHPPQALNFTPGVSNIDITLELPAFRGGTLRNCTMSLNSLEPFTKPIAEGDSTWNYLIGDLEEGKTYEAKAWCCNNRFCSSEIAGNVSTKPIAPEITGSLSVVRKTESTITLRLPKITSIGDGNSSLVVFVQLEGQNKSQNLNDTIVALLEGPSLLTRTKRQTDEHRDQCQKPEWIAAELKQGNAEFVVGDGETHNGFVNCRLQEGQSCTVGVMGVNQLLGTRSYSEPMMESGVVVELYNPSTASPFLLFLLLLLIIPVALMVAFFRLRKPTSKKNWSAQLHSGGSQEVLPQPDEPRGVLANTGPVQELRDLPETPVYQKQPEAIYENLNQEHNADVACQIPSDEVEAYLNKVIGSKQIGDDFKTVPLTLTKSMDVAKLPENKAKNRYINNHPYDDTRVVLSCVNDDPTTDYINASHVKGYRDMRYIASQGPKDTKVSTVADFWRMVIEQNINAIIMVANFVEKGKKKVAEYFSPAQTLIFDGYEVAVHSSEQLPYFTVSTLLVSHGEMAYKIQHYHYTKWPDHGIPSEAMSIAQMLSHFQTHQTKGGVVVHCSAGIGRTGTVLQVLLMCEMLRLKNYLSPIEVLARLRMSRSRLVENEAQYNLSLEILEEILFGKNTVVSTDQLLNHLDKYVHISKAQFARAKALPSPLTFTTSDLPIYKHLNRNQAVLPADSRRYYLQPKPGKDSALSQYINAIRVTGSSREEFMLVTEHPLPHTVASWWRLVAETGSTLVILVNSLDNRNTNDFPTILMEPGKVWQSGQYELQVEQTVPYGTWLKHSTVTITSNQDWVHRVDVYQSLQWLTGSPLPPSPYVLLTLAEVLQIPRGQTSGPPILCCSNGVTGCGLVAGMTLVVQQVQSQQVIDVYRTVVKLLRSRQQFIVNEDQFYMLYKSAATYLKEYSNYGNFQ